MDYRKVIENQIEELERKQKRFEGKSVSIDSYLKIVKEIKELTVIASQLPRQ